MIENPEDLLPMPPTEGPPLPKGVGLKWPGISKNPQEWLPGKPLKEPPLPRWIFSHSSNSSRQPDTKEWLELLEEVSSHPPARPGVYGFGGG